VEIYAPRTAVRKASILTFAREANQRSINKAVRLLRKIRSLMRRIGQEEEQFKRELAALRTAHEAKRNFTKLLDHAKWE